MDMQQWKEFINSVYNIERYVFKFGLAILTITVCILITLVFSYEAAAYSVGDVFCASGFADTSYNGTYEYYNSLNLVNENTRYLYDWTGGTFLFLHTVPDDYVGAPYFSDSTSPDPTVEPWCLDSEDWSDCTVPDADGVFVTGACSSPSADSATTTMTLSPDEWNLIFLMFGGAIFMFVFYHSLFA